MNCSVKGSDRIAELVGRWNPSDFCLLERLEFVGFKNESKGSILVLTGLLQRRDLGAAWPTKEQPVFRVRMRFEGVRALAFRTFDDGPVQIVGFSIANISDRQLEGVRFQIDDYEDGKLSFMCGDASVEVISE